MSDYDIWGRKRSKKQVKRDTIAQNRMKGRLHQNLTEMTYAAQGYEVTRRKTGCDFEAKRRNIFTGRTEHLYVEAKSSPTAPMRKKQVKMKKKKRAHYVVERGGFPI
jgi:hypothetical protein